MLSLLRCRAVVVLLGCTLGRGSHRQLAAPPACQSPPSCPPARPPSPPTLAGILYSIYPPLFAALLVYSVGGTALSLRIGRPLIGLNFQQEAQEANFRWGPRSGGGGGFFFLLFVCMCVCG